MRSGIRVACLTCALCAAGCGRRSSAPPVTFNNDVAPIVFANCASCHRPGEVAPFSLLTYADALKHAAKIAEETRERRMPPWLPEPGEFPILGDRRFRGAPGGTHQRRGRGGQGGGKPAGPSTAPAPARRVARAPGPT